MHVSVKLDRPIEFVDIDRNFQNPLISKCIVKVCYVGDEPNRNKSVITKEVAKELAQSLPGAVVVGYYNEEKQDFEEHNRMIDVSCGKFEIKDTTRPYGFVSLDAKPWFQWFEDDGVEHEYLMTEAYLWTGQYPECRRVIERGNNQSMELDENNLDAYWTKDAKGKPEFFIINEAIMSKLCILGEDVEPCFEGASISSVQFSFDDSFRAQWNEMMNQMQEILNEGGAPVFKYTVNSTSDKAPIENYVSNIEGNYSLVECYSEGEQNFAILQKDDSFYRMNYSFVNDEMVAEEPEVVEYSAAHGYEIIRTSEIVETISGVWDEEGHDVETRVTSITETETRVSGPVEPVEEIKEEPVEPVYAAVEDEVIEETPAEPAVEYIADAEEIIEEQPVEEFAAVEEKVDTAEIIEEVVEEVKFSVVESPEYIEIQNKLQETEANYSASLGLITELKNEKDSLQAQFAELQAKVEALENVNNELSNEINTYKEFKLSVDREKKQAMIDQFYMLNDADKKDVIENIDKYSLDDIEAKLCVACFRNHVSFDEFENEKTPKVEVEAPISYTLNVEEDIEDNLTPAWIKAVREKQKNLNN